MTILKIHAVLVFNQKGIRRFGEIKFDLNRGNIYDGAETGPLKKIE